MLETFTTDFRDLVSVQGVGRGLAAAAGLGATTFVEQTVEKHASGLFGVDVGKGSLTMLQIGMRVLLFLAEILVGLYLVGMGEAYEDVGYGIYAGGWWHIVRLALGQTIGTTIAGVTI